MPVLTYADEKEAKQKHHVDKRKKKKKKKEKCKTILSHNYFSLVNMYQARKKYSREKKLDTDGKRSKFNSSNTGFHFFERIIFGHPSSFISA